MIEALCISSRALDGTEDLNVLTIGNASAALAHAPCGPKHEQPTQSMRKRPCSGRQDCK